jgi:Fe-S oxidoreductase
MRARCARATWPRARNATRPAAALTCCGRCSKGNVLLKDGWKNEAVHEALELCLACKACKTECPVNVDVATYKAEFLRITTRDASTSAAGLSLRLHGSLGEDLTSIVPGVTPGLANLTGQSRWLSEFIKRVAGIAEQRSLPRFAARSFQSAFRSGPLKLDAESAAVA